MTKQPKVITLDNGYSCYFEDDRAEIRITRLHEDSRHSMTGEVEVMGGDSPLIYPVRANLLSYTARTNLAKDLERLDPGGGWGQKIGESFSLVLQKFREGEPSETILGDDNSKLEANYILEPLIYENHPSCLFGGYGSAKSLSALAFCYLLQSSYSDNSLGLVTPRQPINCLYLDYEADKATFKSRWSAICRGFNRGTVPIEYLKRKWPLKDDIEQIKSTIQEKDIKLIIIDSLGIAAGGNLNEAESAINYHTALRQLEVTSLTLAHTAKDSLAQHRTIFGSAYFTNLARMVWEAKIAQEPGENELIISLKNHKSSFSGLHHTLGFHLTFTDNAVQIDKQALEETPLISELSTPTQIKKLLGREGNKPLNKIAESINKSYDTTRITIKRMEKRSIVTQLPDKTWGLKE